MSRFQSAVLFFPVFSCIRRQADSSKIASRQFVVNTTNIISFHCYFTSFEFHFEIFLRDSRAIIARSDGSHFSLSIHRTCASKPADAPLSRLAHRESVRKIPAIISWRCSFFLRLLRLHFSLESRRGRRIAVKTPSQFRWRKNKTPSSRAANFAILPAKGPRVADERLTKLPRDRSAKLRSLLVTLDLSPLIQLPGNRSRNE
jgi:hypothetical protein